MLSKEEKEHLKENTYFASSLDIHSLIFNFLSEAHALVLVQSCMTISKVIIGQKRNDLEL